MKKILFSALICCLCFVVSAQRGKKSDELTYKILNNDPARAKNFSFYFVPVYVELYKPNSDVNMGYGAGINYRFKGDGIFLEGRFTSAYLDRINEEPNKSTQSGKPVNPTKPTMSTGGTITYNFFNKEADEKYDVTIKASGNVRYYTLIPGKMKKMYGVRAGADYYRGEYKFDNGIKGVITDKDTGSTKNYSSTSQEFFTMMHTFTGSVGISRTKIYDLDALMNFKNLFNAPRGVHYTSTVYADLLFAASTTFDNLYVPTSYAAGSSNNYGWYNYHLVDISATKKQSIGYRIGWQQYSTKGFGRTVGVEFGSRPGIAGNSIGDNMYLIFKFAFSFGALLGK